MTTKINLLFEGSQVIVSANEGSMRTAVYLLGRSVGSFNLEIARQQKYSFFKGRKKWKLGQSESK
jgi:hypothetical protein